MAASPTPLFLTDRFSMRSSLQLLALTLITLLISTGCTKKGAHLNPGDPAPNVTLLDQTGTERSIESFRGQPLLVYFYPKDSTPGCTKEACAFRDVWDRYEAAGVAVVGVSTDDVESHAKFAEEHNLPFLLLADTDSELAKGFGLKSRLGFHPRMSFLLDGEGVIRAVYPDVDPGVHAAEVLEDAEALDLAR